LQVEMMPLCVAAGAETAVEVETEEEDVVVAETEPTVPMQ
jgi:hypothetical protein